MFECLLPVVRMSSGEGERRGSWNASTHAAENISADCDKQLRPKRLNLRQCKTHCSRDYNSIDDLSPEYTVLPFVKRLKILNERQKIAELKHALTVVKSSSVDYADCVQEDGEDGSNPPVSGGTDSTSTDEVMIQLGASKPSADENATKPTEGNETPERVNLKKMLKTMSRNELLLPQDQQNRMKLLRSQTVEGYAVRHANFVKLGRNMSRAGLAQTLPSPPSDINKSDPSWSSHAQMIDKASINILLSNSKLPDGSLAAGEASAKKPLVTRHQFSKASVYEGTKEDYVAELFIAIKLVLQDRMVRFI